MTDRDFDKEERELQEKMEEIRAARKKLEETKPVEFRIRNFSGAFAYVVHTGLREDVKRELDSTPGKMYREYEKQYAIPVAEIEKLVARMRALPNVTINYNQGIEDKIHEYLYAANYTVSLTERHLNIKVKTGVTLGKLRYIPGYNFNFDLGLATLPKIEAWRVQDAFEGVDSVDYTEEARDFILKQIESRASLDRIAKMEDIEMEVPGWVKEFPLRNFQKVAVEFMRVNGFRGIDADEMGLGKTPTGLAAAILAGATKTLIVAPASLKVNWIRAIHKFIEKPSIYVLSGRTPSPYDIAHILAEKPQFTIINYDILGTNIEDDQSYIDENGIKHEKIEVRYPWIELLNICKFDMLISDEGHYIKNVDAQRSVAFRKLQAPKFLMLTGTPILNRPGEFWPVLNMLNPTLFPSYTDFISRYTWNGKSARNVDELRTALRPLMIRRLKRDVMKELPAINRINEYSELSPKARKVYDKILLGTWEVMKEWDQQGDKKESVTNMLVRIMRLKQVCAIDKMEATADLATRIYDSTDEGERPKKVLIFSQFKPTAYGITQRLGNECLGFVTRSSSGEFITADERERQRLIDRFQEDKNIHYLVVTEKTAKEGYNITAALAVIFNDLFWTPAAHQQAEGRAYGRIADLHPIDSYYHVATDSIDEWILELLNAKLQLIEAVVEGVNASRLDDSIAMELIKRMKEEMWSSKKR